MILILKDRKGKYVERNGSLTPWINRFDFKIAQDFYATLGWAVNMEYRLVDMLNVGNMINSKWEHINLVVSRVMTMYSY